MSIYIKGLEMPKSCFYCQFQHKNTTECLLTHKYYNWGLTTPPSDCPLIPVPPHGRLIEETEAEKEVGRFLGYLDEDMIYRIKFAIRANVPTVIPANREATK